MIVGLSGYARAGKNEAARGLDLLGFQTVAFADKLREFLYALNPYVNPGIRLQQVIDEYTWDGYKETHFGPEIRGLLQRLGTDCGRNLISDTIWIDATLDHVGAQDIVVADCRFPNEARAIQKRGGIVVRIEKPGIGPVNEHPSETALDNWEFDRIINNNGTIGELHRRIRHLVAVSASPHFNLT